MLCIREQYGNRVPTPIFVFALFSVFVSSSIVWADAPHVLYYKIDFGVNGNGEKVIVSGLVRTINERLGVLGNAKLLDEGRIQVRVNGDIDETELASVKRRISTQGYIDFCYVADRQRSQDKQIIKKARLLGANTKRVFIDGVRVAEWIVLWSEGFDPSNVKDVHIVTRGIAGATEVLVLVDSSNLGGHYLDSATKHLDQRGNPLVDFSFNKEGTALLKQLTSQDKHKDTHRRGRYLGFLLDNQLVGGMLVSRAVTKHMQIRGMTETDSDTIIDIAQAGLLSYRLREDRN